MTWYPFTDGPVKGQILAASAYAPASPVIETVNSATFAAFDSANLQTGPFTVPPSGSILVRANFVAAQLSNTTGIALAVAAHGTVTPILGYAPQFSDAVLSLYLLYAVAIPVMGLTPGATLNLDLLGAVGLGSFNIQAAGYTANPITAANRGAPVVLIVEAL